MTISSSSAQGVNQSAFSAARTQRHQQFDALAQALQSGDANAANAAYASLVPSGSTVDPNSPLGKIGAALQAGNLSAAESALPPRFQNAASGSLSPQFSLADPTQSDSSSDASSASPTSGSTQSASAAAGHVGHHHHHHGGGGGGSLLDSLLASNSSSSSSSSSSTASSSSLPGSGDQTTASFLNARLAMSNLVSDLQSIVSSAAQSSSSTTSTVATPVASNAATGAANLLNNPDFQNLETAFNSGNQSAVNTAWTQFLANTFGANGTATSGAVASTVSAIA